MPSLPVVNFSLDLLKIFTRQKESMTDFLIFFKFIRHQFLQGYWRYVKKSVPALLSFFILIPSLHSTETNLSDGLPIYYWQQPSFVNFGDYLSVKLIERIVEQPVRIFQKKRFNNEKKLLAIGSILIFGLNEDVIWGTGLNGKRMDKSFFQFTNLDVRAVRGPLTRQFLKDQFQIDCPETYGDPALLLPYFFPEFQRKQNPKYDYIIIPHYSEKKLFPREGIENIIYPTDPWDEIIEKITDSRFVISSSLHGIIVAEAFGIPARLLKITDNEPLFKYQDYYLGTNRPYFQYATSIEEALEMGGEPPFACDLKKLYQSFPFEYWKNSSYKTPNFK